MIAKRYLLSAGKSLFLLLLIMLFSVFSVYALSVGGVSSNGMEAYAGQSVERLLDIENFGSDSVNLVMESTVEQGAEIISFPAGRRINVPAGEVATVRLRVTIPSGVSVGREYPVRIIFRTIEGGVAEGGSVAFSTNIGKEFVVKVVEKPSSVEEAKERAGANTALWIIAIIIIIIVLWWLLKKKK